MGVIFRAYEEDRDAKESKLKKDVIISMQSRGGPINEIKIDCEFRPTNESELALTHE